MALYSKDISCGKFYLAILVLVSLMRHLYYNKVVGKMEVGK